MSSSYKGGLAVGGTAFDKSKLLRRPTPDSDALASSDDDRDHVQPTRKVNNNNPAYPTGRRPSSGWLQDIQPANRKFSLPTVSFAGSQPTTPSELPPQSRQTNSFPWNTSSFTSNSAGTRFKDVLPSPTSAHPLGDRALPSPTAESDETIGFLLSQPNAVRKAVRSQSYSVGQGDIDPSPAQLNTRLRSSLRHRPSKPSLLSESLGLTQLREDDIDEMESSNGSEQGVRLPAGYWERETNQYLLKQAAEQNARRNRATSAASSGNPHNLRKSSSGVRNMPSSDYAVDEHDEMERHYEMERRSEMPLTRRFSEHIGGLGRHTSVDAANVPVAQDWSVGNVQGVNPEALGRRHSFAHYISHTSTFQLPTLGNTQEEDEDELSPLQPSGSPGAPETFDHTAYFTGYGPASRAINASAISAAHPDPATHIVSSSSTKFTAQPSLGRPGRRFFVVAFKCSRADVFYTYDNTGLEIRRGDLVICEGDRGVDLGQVIHADVTQEDAKRYKATAIDEHLRWLVMFSQYSVAGTGNNNPMLGALARAHSPSNINRTQLAGMGAQQDPDAKPKMIKRLAQQHEIYSLRDKEGQEAKAKRIAVAKTADHGFPMEILDAEFQADHHKITFFYYAEHYVNFNPLVQDLFKHYKIRIWMSAVNPASVINPAGLAQIAPPSAIGPGAILHSNPQNASLSVGPGFGNNSYRSNEQRGRGRGQAMPQQGNYEDSYYAFSQQLPAYASQQGYQMPWGAQAQPMTADMYGRYGFPNANSNGSPMNFGAWAPPSTYSASPAFNHASSGPSYRGGYPATSSAATTMSATYGGASTAGPTYGQYPASGMQMPSYSSAGPAYGQYGSIAPQGFAQPGHGASGGLTATSGATASPGPVATSGVSGEMSASFSNLSVGK
ncbi:hypothetical protein P280DRAFT_395542 [Massarina eburnea CBS 473.64]|uniref:PSP1 C-terminal domain-containing protein n=1 Tax=Massarina eburnea CBS 473.64 TaxID=1395130 RepID=A0A6A6S7T5_9PLEO|nr:hypothetical protein P280DRAFT_395542 [Massarina eburnea CBS 473.64]